jgi:arsenite methyltransferase
MTDASREMTSTEVREEVRARYAAAAAAVSAPAGRSPLVLVDSDQCCAPSTLAGDEATCCSSTTEVGPAFGASLYPEALRSDLPVAAVTASLGCGNPIMGAELREGERVLDLGSGGGIDVLLSARRVGPTGFAYGVDMTDEMLDLARRNAAQAGVENVEFIKGVIEDLPLPDASVDVVISNCVVNLSTDKQLVLEEAYRVLTPGGRLGFSDVVADDDLTPEQRAERGSFVGCIAGALSRSEYLDAAVRSGSTSGPQTPRGGGASGYAHPVTRSVTERLPDPGTYRDADRSLAG